MLLIARALEEKMHIVNPAKKPPPELLAEASRWAHQNVKTVYVFQCSEGWAWVKKLQQVPAGSLITEVVGNRDATESWNTGGC